jgi:hypothetical protein
VCVSWVGFGCAFSVPQIIAQVQRCSDVLVSGLPRSAIELIMSPSWKGGHIITMQDTNRVQTHAMTIYTQAKINRKMARNGPFYDSPWPRRILSWSVSALSLGQESCSCRQEGHSQKQSFPGTVLFVLSRPGAVCIFHC